MSLITFVLPLAACLAVFWLLAFAWSARTGQMDDLDSPAARMLHDDEEPRLQESEEDRS